MKNLYIPASWMFTIVCFVSYREEFQDNDDAGGFYKTIEYGNIYQTRLYFYFDGKYVRLEKRKLTPKEFVREWFPSENYSNVADLIGISGSMYAPLDQNLAKLPKYWILFNETYLIPPETYKNRLKGLPSQITNLSLYQCFPKCGPQWSLDFEESIAYTSVDLSKIDFSAVTWNLKDFLGDYTAMNAGANVRGWYDVDYRKEQTTCKTPGMPNFCGKELAKELEFESRKKTGFPFQLSYRDTKRICYSPSSSHNFASVHESMTLDLERMSSTLAHQEQNSDLPYLRIYIHMPGQFIRMLGREVASYATPNLMGEHCEFLTGLFTGHESIKGLCSGSKVTFLLSQVTLLKKRQDAREPCNEKLDNEDGQLLASITAKVGCIPSYWKDIIDKRNQSFSICTESAQYRSIQKYVSDITLARTLFMQPCEDMLVVTNILKERGRLRRKSVLEANEMTSYLDLEIIQGSEMYQEIENVKDFGVESCWSGIGGFVGIFLGYSLLQIPELIANYFEVSRKRIFSQLK